METETLTVGQANLFINSFSTLIIEYVHFDNQFKMVMAFNSNIIKRSAFF